MLNVLNAEFEMMRLNNYDNYFSNECTTFCRIHSLLKKILKTHL